MPCGIPKKRPRTTKVVQFIFYFLSFEISRNILRKSESIIGLYSYTETLWKRTILYFTVFSHMVGLMIFSLSYFMPVYNEKRFAVIWLWSCHSFWRYHDVRLFFNNLRLKRRCLFKFENNEFKLVAIRPYSLKNTKSFGNLRLFTLSVAAFLCWCQL